MVSIPTMLCGSSTTQTTLGSRFESRQNRHRSLLPEKQQFEEVAGAYNATLLGKLLRERMGFKGYINTDSGVLSNNAFGVEKLTLPERFAKAVKAGVSLFSDNSDPKGLIDAVNQHLLNEEDLNPSVTYLLTEMFHLGLFEDPYTDPEKAQAIANSTASAARADEAHRKSIVLLRNDKKLLPDKGREKDIRRDVRRGCRRDGRTRRRQGSRDVRRSGERRPRRSG